MVLKKLSAEQVDKMTLEEKDQWWINNVYRGKVPQLTFRSIFLGCILGSVQSIISIYIGIKIPFGGGSGVLAVICAFLLFNLSQKITNNVKHKDSIIECNAVQSISISAAISIFPLTCSLSAYMLFANTVVPLHKAILWLIVTSILGVIYAMFFKKNIINDLQLPCQEGAACAVVLDTLTDKKAAKIKVRCLTIPFLVSAVIELLKSDKIFSNKKIKFLPFPDSFSSLFDNLPRYFGYKLTDLGVNIETSFFTFSLGGMMKVSTALSMFVGGIIFYMIIAPILLQKNIITLGYKAAMSWSVWPGVVMMTAPVLWRLFGNIKDVFLNYKSFKKDILEHIEVPRKLLVLAFIIVSIITIEMAERFFGISYYIGVICILMSYFLSYVASYAGGMTSIVPVGGVSKISQIITTILSSGKVGLAAAGLTGEIANNAGGLLIDLKPGYMLGAGPRQQVIGHVIGTFIGTIVGALFFYSLIIPKISEWGTSSFPMPGTMIWKTIAELLSQNWWQVMHPSTIWAMVIGLAASIILEFLSSKKILNLCPSMIGFGLFLPFNYSIEIFLGSLFTKMLLPWLAKKSKVCEHMSENSEIVCTGLLVGNSVLGILIMAITQLL